MMCKTIEGTAFLPHAGPKNIGSIYKLQGVLARLRLTFVYRRQGGTDAAIELANEASYAQAHLLLLPGWVDTIKPLQNELLALGMVQCFMC